MKQKSLMEKALGIKYCSAFVDYVVRYTEDHSDKNTLSAIEHCYWRMKYTERDKEIIDDYGNDKIAIRKHKKDMEDFEKFYLKVKSEYKN